ncbi:hypothetical protein HJG60_008290 [Phyllostomus discolor]|uniref:Uncharacterized protein n=1 Tax=Phyllostomus discolor TaxID=89673 RepID=A0A834DM12_9CHIR|nr:hypothetical protein HJG60_008290 [Phyllostomus discolor]
MRVGIGGERTQAVRGDRRLVLTTLQHCSLSTAQTLAPLVSDSPSILAGSRASWLRPPPLGPMLPPAQGLQTTHDCPFAVSTKCLMWARLLTGGKGRAPSTHRMCHRAGARGPPLPLLVPGDAGNQPALLAPCRQAGRARSHPVSGARSSWPPPLMLWPGRV